VPADKIEIIWRPVSSTFDEAALAREYADAHRLRSILVVTSAYHSRRALWTFRRAFRGSGVAVGVEAVAPGGRRQSPAPGAWWLSRLGWQMVAGEYVKLIYYRCRYGEEVNG
jgi:uncharacterized SAM-binding protein YcdF (DUF218 family)